MRPVLHLEAVSQRSSEVLGQLAPLALGHRQGPAVDDPVVGTGQYVQGDVRVVALRAGSVLADDHETELELGADGALHRHHPLVDLDGSLQQPNPSIQRGAGARCGSRVRRLPIAWTDKFDPQQGASRIRLIRFRCDRFFERQEALIQYPITRYLYRPLSTRVAGALSSTSVTPMAVTWASAVMALGGAALLAGRYYVAGALVTFAAVIADCADGDLARATGRSSPVGAFLDSVLDRWTDAALVVGLMYSDLDAFGGVGALALTASLLTSYTRARAQSLGTDCPEGIGGRDTRVLILVIGALVGAIWWALLLVAVSGFVTSIQRGYLAAKRLSEAG